MARKFGHSRGLIGLINNFIYLLITKFSFVLLIVVFCTIFMLQKNEYKGYLAVRSAVIDYTAPMIARVGDGFNSVFEIREFFNHIITVYHENEELRNKIENLQIYSHLYEKVRFENVELKKLVKYLDKNENQSFAARVLINSNSPFSRSVIMSVGALEGVYKGQVIVNDKGIVGKVVEVNDHTSRVLLIFDPNSRISVISVKNRERGIAIGNNSNDLELNYMSDGAILEEGEMFISSGDGELIPYGIPVGRVKKLDNNKVIIKPFVNINQLEYVVAIDNSN